MKIFVKVKPNAKEERIEKVAGEQFQVWVKEPPKQGKANKAVIEILSDYFHIPKSQIKIISGLSSKQKCVEIKNW